MTNSAAQPPYPEPNNVEKKPTFFWQAVLILLPMVLLVAVGFYSLRQDKALAEAEAKERAQRYADDFARYVSGLIAGVTAGQPGSTNVTQLAWFTVSNDGDLISPPPIAPLNPSVLTLDKLSAAQKQLWQDATQAEFTTNRHAAIVSYRDFLASNPPAQFRARAAYALALLLGNSEEATKLLSQTMQLTNAVSDAGFPLALLARIKLVDFKFASTNAPTPEAYKALNNLCEAVVAKPSVLTPSILEFCERLESAQQQTPLLPLRQVSRAKHQWASDELARNLYDASKKHFTLPKGPVILLNPTGTTTNLNSPTGGTRLSFGTNQFWIDADESYLAIAHDGFVTEVTCCPATNLTYPINKTLESYSQLYDYFGIVVEIAGRQVARYNTRPWREESYFSPRGAIPGTVTKKEYLTTPDAIPPILATATGSAGAETLKVHVVLTNRDALFKTQQARRNWFGAVILVSAVVAGSGLWRSWRTFTRQQQLNEMKSNFVSSVSHELRAPIASVRLLAEALDRGAVSEQPKQKEYFRFIVQECRRLTGLIENVLDFSRIEQGRKNYQFEETDLNALVDQTVKLMKPMADERGVKLERSEFNVQCSMFNVVCDGLAVQQALVNLIDNAIKHSPAKQTVFVALKREHRTLNTEHRTSNEIIQLSVTDQGPGIPASEHEKIFERFYRRGSELRRETQGIGIGLTIVKHVAEAHGGRVMVESAVGKGSTFTIELPLNLETK